MCLTVAVNKTVTTAAEASENVLHVACMFGLGVDEHREEVIVPETSIPIPAGQVVYITGASGSGKSTILRLVKERLSADKSVHLIDFDDMNCVDDATESDASIVDGFGEAPLRDVLRWLSIAGLNDAFVMLRKPRELSDGQRYRLKLAKAIGEAESLNAETDEIKQVVVLADEFGATLDRVTAKVIGKNIQRWVKGSLNGMGLRSEDEEKVGVTLVVATTHDDLMEALEPGVLVEKGLGGEIGVFMRENKCERAGE
ncbi:ATP-binding cassette domain-containing protein [Planctomycetota bacterium]|nr:ATP-binding cassette domain-containing protein [Planctomycetota bacterium]